MSMTNLRLKVAIIGGGPGGLGAAIELGKLPFVDWNLYEKKPQISETGGGISLQRHTWRLLDILGASKDIDPQDFFRASDGVSGQTRNGRTGELLEQNVHGLDVPENEQSCRMVRAKLQKALLQNVDAGRVHVNKKLIGIKRVHTNGRLRVEFSDGDVDEIDLLVGADGIRSVVRSFAFPSHSIKYNGQSAYRTIISKSRVYSLLPDFPRCPVFWQNTGGKYLFTCPLGNDDFEVTARIRRPLDDTSYVDEQVSWGRSFDFSTLVHEYDDFYEPLRQVIQLAASPNATTPTQEFALFSGPRVETVVSDDALALIGDASHPLSGAFGAGAGFALEDAYALTRCLDHVWRGGGTLSTALKLYDGIRSPHYKALYGVLDDFAELNAILIKENLGVDKEIEERAKRTGEKKTGWMYSYEITKVVEKALALETTSEARTRWTVESTAPSVVTTA